MALIGYARVSVLEEEEPWLQHDALEAAGCTRVFTDRASGAAEERPELARLYDHLREGDTLVVARLDRIARSQRDLVDTIGVLAERGVGLRSLDGSLETTGAKGKAVVAVCAALAEFELDIVRERAALAAVGLREPREPRLGALLDAARNRPARRSAAEPDETVAEPPPEASSPDEKRVSARRTAGGSRVVRQRRARTRTALAAAAPTPPATPAPAPAPAPRRGRRRALIAVQILAAAGAAFAALQVGQSGAQTAVVLAHPASNPDLVLGVPADWRRSSSDLAVTALGLRDAIVLLPGSIGGATIMAGMSSATGATLLPAALTQRLDRVPRPASVRLDRMTALRYADLPVGGLTRRMTIFAVPTSRGVLTLACLAPPRDAAALRPVCDRVAQSLRLKRGRALASGPSARYQAGLNALVGTLDAVRADERAKLASAGRASQQARRAERLADAYAQAHATGSEQEVSPREAAAHARILAALGATRAAYAQMADAAHVAGVGAYERGTDQVGIGERRVRAALTALTALGYEIAPTSRPQGS